ncbi:MAG: rhomboid family intramembrane serine protease [Elusimicrobia bacterium]|nr:rhomboid family intramembrane serine protease [Elusimicrobiota bacterium]
MIPLRDNIPSRRFPAVNLLLILGNAAAFFYELSLGAGLEPFLLRYSLVPARYAAPGLLHALGPVNYLAPFFTSLFLHGGWAHVLSNMWMLFIFGDNVEDRMGHFRYLLFYLLCGLCASAAQLWASWGSSIPTLGASGAIAGVLGAYFILYPYARVLTVIPIFVFLKTVEIPASLFLGIWIWSQFYSGSLSLAGTRHLGGVAWWAHIGGFMGGIALLGLFLEAKRGRR